MMLDHSVPDRSELDTAWREFLSNGHLRSSAVVRTEVAESWKRCRQRGLDPSTMVLVSGYTEEEKQQRLRANSVLINTARPFMQGLYDLIMNLEVVIFLTDRDGFILEAVGDGVIRRFCEEANVGVGGSLNERYFGTNSVALALRYDQPYQMMPGEQYVEGARMITCAAAPIHNEAGDIIGCLTITAHSDVASRHPYTLGMIVTSAQVIEHQVRFKKESARSFMTSEYLKVSMETIPSGFIILDRDNRIAHFNSAAERILGLDLAPFFDMRKFIRNEVLLDAIRSEKELHDYELIFDESPRSPRCLVTVSPIVDSQGQRMGNVLNFQETSSVQKLAQKVVGFSVRYTFDDIKGKSPQLKESIRLGRAAARSESNVLLIGESGTGKEMFAQSIHNAGSMSCGPFIGINCAAIPNDLIESELFGYEAGTFTGCSRGGKAGKFELAEGGTLFLDEVNGMPLSMQAKLLRVLEEKKFFRLGGSKYFNLNARIIAATNKDLMTEVENGNFRSDLFYRLNVMEITIPALRERTGDIEELVNVFVETVSMELGREVPGITREALTYLKQRPWRGNVRELKNWIERAINISDCPVLDVDDFPVGKDCAFPKRMRPDDSPPMQPLDDIEMQTIIDAISQCSGNIARCSRMLGISRATLYRRLKKYDVSVNKVIS